MPRKIPLGLCFVRNHCLLVSTWDYWINRVWAVQFIRSSPLSQCLTMRYLERHIWRSKIRHCVRRSPQPDRDDVVVAHFARHSVVVPRLRLNTLTPFPNNLNGTS